MASIELLESIECGACGTLSRGIKLPGGKLCFDCCSNDPELVRQIVFALNPEMASRLGAVIDRLMSKKDPMQ